MSCDFTKSMAISLKRLEIAKVVDLKTWSVLNGFKSFASSAWLRLCDEEKELRDELAELEMTKEQPKEKSDTPFTDACEDCKSKEPGHCLPHADTTKERDYYTEEEIWKMINK